MATTSLREWRPAGQFSGGSVQTGRCLLTADLTTIKNSLAGPLRVCPQRSRSPQSLTSNTKAGLLAQC